MSSDQGWQPVGASVVVNGGTASSQAQLGWAALGTRPAALPSNARVTNTGTAAAYVAFGTTSGVAATVSGSLVPAGGERVFALNAASNMAAITAAGTTTLVVECGQGRP